MGAHNQLRQDLNRLVATGIAIAVLIASAFPPFHSGSATYDRNLGYAFLFLPPSRGSIDFGRLCIEYVATFAIGALAWLLLSSDGLIETSLRSVSHRIPPRGIRIIKFTYLVAIVVAILECLAASKLVGLFALGIYGIAVLIYFLGKYAAPAAKQDLLVVTAVMGAQACWGILAGTNALMNTWTGIVELTDQQTNNAFIGLSLEILYIAAIVWFFRKTTLRATATLFLYAGFLLCVYWANVQFDLLAMAAKNAAALQISIFILALLLLPASYYEYSNAVRT